jgi:propanediol dehydratase large subunit
MKFSNLLAVTAVANVVDLSFAYPGMRNMAAEIKQAVKNKRDEPVEMIGDLVKGATTPVGKLIQSCLLGQIDCYDDVDLKVQLIGIQEQLSSH